MHELTDSTPLLADPESLRRRFLDEGYVLLRDVISKELLLDVRRDITDVCDKHGWLRADRDPMDAIACVEPRVEGEDPFFEVYDDIQRLESFHSVPHHPSVRRCITPLLGDDAFPHPLGIARLAFPDDEWATPPHQDHPNNQGTTDLYACWIPLSDCPRSLGPLSILRGSHRVGVLPLVPSLGAGSRRVELDPDHEQLGWVDGDLQLGDALLFHSLTVHRALPNREQAMRLSVDFRFQAAGDRLTETCLQPHFGRLTWDEIYEGWRSDDLKYYWRDLAYDVVPWDQSFFEISEADYTRHVAEFITWRQDDADLEQVRKQVAEQMREQIRLQQQLDDSPSAG